VLFQGVPAWNAWREANPNVQPELGGITLLFYLGKNFAYHPPGPRTRAGV
jgi:hypothetical protein